MTYAERRALQEGPQPPKQAPRTTPVPERRDNPGVRQVDCPVCHAQPGEGCHSVGPVKFNLTHHHIGRLMAFADARAKERQS